MLTEAYKRMTIANPYSKQANIYRQNQIETATPEEILIMLYEGAIRFLVVAKKGVAENDMQKCHENVLRSQHIIREFMDSLDMEIGGEMAMNLYRLYEYLHYRMIQFNIKKDVAMADEVLDHLRSLKTTWEEAIRIAKTEQAAGKRLEASQGDDVAENATTLLRA